MNGRGEDTELERFYTATGNRLSSWFATLANRRVESITAVGNTEIPAYKVWGIL